MGGLTLVDAWSYMEPVLAWKMFILLKINQPKQSEALDPQTIGYPTSKAVYRKALLIEETCKYNAKGHFNPF